MDVLLLDVNRIEKCCVQHIVAALRLAFSIRVVLVDGINLYVLEGYFTLLEFSREPFVE